MALTLAGIAAHAAKRVARLSAETPLEELARRPLYARAPAPVPLEPGVAVHEIRFADPQRGFLVPREQATPEEAARRAAASGAAVVAVWVERNFHAGDWTHLEAVRAGMPGAVLIARDFVVDRWQLSRARAAGADGIELIEPVLGPAFGAFAAAARELGLTPVAWDAGTPRAVPRS